MSKYTTEVRFICETLAGKNESEGQMSVNTIIDSAIPKLFDFGFPIFDEKYRNVLCHKILKHYYTREICEETVGLWKLRLDSRLNEIMPYYNQLYKSELIEFNPMYDVDMRTENNGSKNENVNKTNTDTAKNETSANTTANNSGTTTNDDVRRDLYSDTPQGSLQNVENETYLTNARKIGDSKREQTSNSASGTSNSTTDYTNNSAENSVINSTDQYVNIVRGKNGGASYSKLLQEFRSTFLNIDTMIIENLNDLFFGLW